MCLFMGERDVMMSILILISFLHVINHQSRYIDALKAHHMTGGWLQCAVHNLFGHQGHASYNEVAMNNVAFPTKY